MTPLQKRILRALRSGPLDQFQIAADIGEAPFTVRGELRALKRERLVLEHLSSKHHNWSLSVRGYTIAWSLEQPELTA